MQVARFSAPSGRGNKSDDDDDGMDAAQLAQLRNSLPELLRDSWVPPSEPRDKLDYSMLPHAIEAEPRAPAGAPLVHIVFSDHIVQTIKQLRFEREFFVWRKRFESPLTAAFKRLVDARNQEYTEKKRSWRREHRTLLKEVHHHKTALFRTVRERRAFKFAAPLQRRYVVGCWLLVVACSTLIGRRSSGPQRSHSKISWQGSRSILPQKCSSSLAFRSRTWTYVKSCH